MRVSLAALLYSVLACGVQPAIAEETGWRDRQGNPLPNTPTRQQSQGFAGNVILTSDTDWLEKWQKPETPHYTSTEDVKLGQTVTLLVLFSNPAPDKDGLVKVTCDIQVIRPDGSLSTNEKNLVCAAGKLEGSPYDLRLADVTPGFTGEATDAPGTWIIRVRLTDTVRKVSVDLEQKFEYHKD